MECAHDELDTIDDPVHGKVCTACGMVLDGVVFSSPESESHAPPDTACFHWPYARTHPLAGLQRRVDADERDTVSGIRGVRKTASAKSVESVCRSLLLHDAICDTAKEMHLELVGLNPGFRGKWFDVSAASAVYFACMTHGVGRGEVEFAANVPGLARSDLTACNKSARRLFKRTKFAQTARCGFDPASLVPRVLAAMLANPPLLEFGRESHRVRAEAERLLGSDSVRRSMQGRTPECVCASAMCVAIERVQKKKTDRKVVATRCGISLASLNSIVRAIEPVDAS